MAAAAGAGAGVGVSAGAVFAPLPAPKLAGLMQPAPLLISSLIDYAAQQHSGVELVTRTVEDPKVWARTTYGAAAARAKRLANVLRRWGVAPGDRIATLAWNTTRHFELYFAISGIGAVCHTLNPRLFVEQLQYIIGHAQDAVLFFDVCFLKLVATLRPLIPCTRFVVMTDAHHMPDSCRPLALDFANGGTGVDGSAPFHALCYEHLIAADIAAGHSIDWRWPVFHEDTASSLCYTSGTTGNPKGVLYSHRSTVLHSWAVCARDGLGLSSADTVFLVVPLFHANAWGIPYAAAMCGAKLVFPAEYLTGADVYAALTRERCTLTCGVPTVWLALFQHIDALPAAERDPRVLLPALERVGIGGSACPAAMIKRFLTQFARPVPVLQIWGMTEMSPLGTVGNLLPRHNALSIDGKVAAMAKQGRFLYGVQATVLDDNDKPLPRDGKSAGNLCVAGPWIAAGYFRDAKASEKLYVPGTDWMVTGDVCHIDGDGYMQITDRSKDVIKSGGEWLSSIDLENAAVAHPAVAEAAVIGLPHPKWQERPLLLVVKKSGAQHANVTKADILALMQSHGIARWGLPDDVLFVKDLPHTATGKLLKTKLREQFKDYRFPDADADATATAATQQPIRSAL